MADDYALLNPAAEMDREPICEVCRKSFISAYDEETCSNYCSVQLNLAANLYLSSGQFINGVRQPVYPWGSLSNSHQAYWLQIAGAAMKWLKGEGLLDL